jgi:hypothetical protein
MRISTLCVVSSTLAAFALSANGASAAQVDFIHTSVPQVHVHLTTPVTGVGTAKIHQPFDSASPKFRKAGGDPDSKTIADEKGKGTNKTDNSWNWGHGKADSSSPKLRKAGGDPVGKTIADEKGKTTLNFTKQAGGNTTGGGKEGPQPHM